MYLQSPARASSYYKPFKDGVLPSKGLLYLPDQIPDNSCFPFPGSVFTMWLPRDYECRPARAAGLLLLL